MQAPSPFLNRELSWLEFNQRVLDEARDPTVPLLERLKFLAITASNLDEFFMVRVGGLHLLRRSGQAHRDPSELLPEEQLDAIHGRVTQLVRDQYETFAAIEEELRGHQFTRMGSEDLKGHRLEALAARFQSEIVSILAPLSVTTPETFPNLINRSLSLAVRMLHDDETRFAVIPFARALPRFITLPSESGLSYILIEDAVAPLAHQFFPGDKVIEVVPFRITRNADLSIREDQTIDLMSGMEKVIDARDKSHCVRLEIGNAASPEMVGFLRDSLGVSDEVIQSSAGPVDLTAFFEISMAKGFGHLRYDPHPALPSPRIDIQRSLFEQIAEEDILLYHPYDSYEPVVRFLEEAADDPDVLAIKQTLYRCSRDSAIIAALKRAARKNKYITVIVELKARFDEERNIEWARDLESENVQVFYGVRNLKTHAKMCAVVRREPQGIKRYLHFGTGNYNESTANLYSDASLFTADPDMGNDAIGFFNAITGYSEPRPFQKLDMAPTGLRNKLLELIDVEIQEKKQGRHASIQAKVNSLVDIKLIEALYRASQAGVSVKLNVRGICCLKPGIQGLSENIVVVSVIDQFLEHARITHFHHGGSDRVFLSSADWMTRNLDRRIELLIPIENRRVRKRLLHILESYFRDNCKAHRLNSDGSYSRLRPHGGSPVFRSQEILYQEHLRALDESRTRPPTTFEPYRAPNRDT